MRASQPADPNALAKVIVPSAPAPEAPEGRALTEPAPAAVSAPAAEAAVETVARVIEPPKPAVRLPPPPARSKRRWLEAIRLRVADNRSGLLGFSLAVLVPTAIAAIYVAFIATPQYASEFHFSVQSQSQASPTGNGVSISSGGGGKVETFFETFIVVDYIKSRQALVDMLERTNLREIYEAENIDYFSRMSSDASLEKMLRYWNRRIDVTFDLVTGLAVVTVRAFSAQDAQKLAQLVLDLSEKLINDNNRRPRLDYLKFAQAELVHAEQRLDEARKRQRDIRATQRSVDPNIDASMAATLIGKLNEQIATLNSQAAALRPQLNASAPSMIQLDAQIRSLQEQVTQVKSLIGDKTNKGKAIEKASAAETMFYAEQMVEFQAAQTDFDLAVTNYKTASQVVDLARRAVGEQHSYVLASVRPGEAQISEYPSLWRTTLLTFLAATALWCVGVLLFFSMRDKA